MRRIPVNVKTAGKNDCVCMNENETDKPSNAPVPIFCCEKFSGDAKASAASRFAVFFAATGLL